MIDENTGTISIDESWTDGSLEPISGVYTLEAYGAALIAELHKGRTVRVEDTATDPRTAKIGDAFPSQGVRARLSVPVVRAARTRAVFFLHDTEPRVWTDEEVALVEEAASAHLDRDRARPRPGRGARERGAFPLHRRLRADPDVGDQRRPPPRLRQQDLCRVPGRRPTTSALNLDWRKILHPDDWDRILAGADRRRGLAEALLAGGALPPAATGPTAGCAPSRGRASGATASCSASSASPTTSPRNARSRPTLSTSTNCWPSASPRPWPRRSRPRRP